jgi:hypothetical protein
MSQAFSQNRRTALTGLAVVALAALASGACGRKFEKHPMAVGQTIVLKPMTRPTEAPSPEKAKNVRLVIDVGGKEIERNDDIEIAFYAKAGDETPLRVFSPKELLNMYRATDCNQEMMQFLENAMLGDSLFCNGNLDLAKVGHFVARIPGKADKTASAPVLEYEDMALGFASYTLTFY